VGETSLSNAGRRRVVVGEASLTLQGAAVGEATLPHPDAQSWLCENPGGTAQQAGEASLMHTAGGTWQ